MIVRDLCLAGCALSLGYAVVHVNMEVGCGNVELQILLNCPLAEKAPADAQRLAQEPGNAALATQLALSAKGAARRQQLEAAGRLAPQEPNLLLARAGAAAEQGDLAAAVTSLVTVAQLTNSELALAPLVKLITAGGGALLIPHLTADSRWLFLAIERVVAAGGPASDIGPLVVDGVRKDALDSRQLDALLRKMVEQKQATDAYAIWAALSPQGRPLLFNGDFTTALNDGVFNWSTPRTRSGVALRLRGDGTESMLEVQFTGRAFEPTLMRQPVMLAAGDYRLEGEWKASQLRLEGGLGWALRCEGQKADVSGTPLIDTAGKWQRFQFSIKVPESCGPVASLELRTGAEYEGRTGTSGSAALRKLSLTRAR